MPEAAAAEQHAQPAQPSLLDQAVRATRQTDAGEARRLLRTLTDQALQGTVSWERNLSVTFRKAIAALDEAISEQLREIMHQPAFQRLEGSWRGLNHLVMNSETGTSLKIRVLNASKKEVAKDLSRAVEFDQSQTFKKLYETEFGSPGGEPYGALVGDYEFGNHPDDLELLGNISQVAAAAFCPFLSAADPALFGFSDWRELSRPRDLAKIFDSAEYIKWRAFRESEDSRFVTLTLPRVLSRLPYGAETRPVEAFDFEELEPARLPGNADYSWMNAAYMLAGRLTQAFARYGWCTAIRGAEGGGRVDGLPVHLTTTDDGDIAVQCPTEIAITDRREAELSGLGFMPLSHYKNTDYAVFFGGQSAQKPKTYDRPEATANAAISARLPYVMATARIAHYLKVMARDKVGSFMEAEDMEAWLNRWINNYVNASEQSGQDMRAKYPLREAKIQVRPIPGKPGCYNAVAWLRPWLQLEELSSSLRMVARIPEIGG
ncbi:type VI secretion system contractile sheath large subunit [Alkalilimnicola sp. S0819]|uniref:type VI secretion system contractile sheath large subunit n=1 Tax=Alkalilimnicola sp. S0819 TaxID=2613922 RepID=UPI0012623C23|nr:type VI secretion system contractile sheath large subunit [Alkalilimnicola sp. S0819]KAB7622589.1 type VI secretion system contractile sheath large subunit [Alkalilimnicola sp. S0819]MPQ17479.1 type VI secretion system contractile sheath large subunit [Alkalilimnicola sp. S0819]